MAARSLSMIRSYHGAAGAASYISDKDGVIAV
jgi:hypothetical protein